MRKLLLFFALFMLATAAFGQDLTVAAAADLSSVLPEIAKQFEAKTGKHINLTFGSSGNITQQTQNGAPYDVFFSADSQFPQKLNEAGLVEPGTTVKYAVGKIVLFVPSSSKLDLSRGPSVLLSPDVKKIAIANPVHAPYGRAAVEALKKEGLYDQVKNKFVVGENISQAAQYVGTGNTDAGIIALSLAFSMKDKGHYVEMPTADYTPIEQAAVVLKKCKDKQTAKAFFDFLKTPAVRNTLIAHGFTLPN